MFQHLKLVRPLAVLDLETTGTDTQTARIVEVSVLRISPPDVRVHCTRRVNPTIPIPESATAVQGIKDADVAGKPRFADIAKGLASFLHGCDLCGFNLKRYDLKVLHCEFRRTGIEFPLAGRAIIDPLEIFHFFERRDLTAAVKVYLDREHDGRHSAAADVLATAEVLDVMLARYQDLPRKVADLHQQFRDPNAVDSSGYFTRIEGQIRFSFGRYRGQPLETVARDKPDYLRWMLNQDFFDDTKAVVKEALTR